MICDLEEINSLLRAPVLLSVGKKKEKKDEKRLYILSAMFLRSSCFGGGGLFPNSHPTLVTPWTEARQAPLSMGLPRQEYWISCHFLLQGIFTTQGLNPGLLHCRQIFLPTGEVLRRQAASCLVGEGVRVLAGLRKEMLGNRRNLYCGEADSKGGTVK